MKPIILYPNWTVKEVMPKNGTDFKIDELHEHVQCQNVEIVRTSDDRLMVIDEEGKLSQKPMNIPATMLYGNKFDYIAGIALVCDTGMVK